MNLKNKLIIGCAQTDEKYGLSKHKKFEEVLSNAIKSGERERERYLTTL